MAEDKAQKLPAHLRDDLKFKPGQSGNPAGRPKGSRTRLGEQFLSDLMVDWEQHGAASIKDMREKSPSDYVKVVAATLPKELNVKVSELEELSDEQLEQRLASLSAQLARAKGEDHSGTVTAQPARSIN